MKFVVGGEEYDLTREEVERRMRGVEPEVVRKHVVEMLGTVYPPKQVFGTVTRRPRTSFTTMEAQRVLSKLGFRCRTADRLPDGTPAWLIIEGRGDDAEGGERSPSRLTALEARLDTAMAAVQGLAARVAALEGKRDLG